LGDLYPAVVGQRLAADEDQIDVGFRRVDEVADLSYQCRVIAGLRLTTSTSQRSNASSAACRARRPVDCERGNLGLAGAEQARIAQSRHQRSSIRAGACAIR
jgi:hypothetical protein